MTSSLQLQRHWSDLAALIRRECAARGSTLLGAVVGGSHVYGDPLPDSDYDVNVLLAEHDKRWKTIVREDTIEADIAAAPYDLTAKIVRFPTTNNAHPIELYARGLVLLDRNAVTVALCREAKRCFLYGPPACDPQKTATKLIRLGQWLTRARGALGSGDAPTAMLLISATLTDAAWVFFAIRRIWNSGLKVSLTRIRANDPILGEHFDRAYTAPDISDRLESTTRVLEHLQKVLEREGGLSVAAAGAMPETAI